MDTRLRKALQKHENLIKDGKITSFTVFVQEKGVLIKPAGSGDVQRVALIQEMLTTLRALFHGKAIEYGSADYAALKGLVHARSR